MELTKQQRFELLLQYGSLADIAPTLELLTEIESRLPTEVLGPGVSYVTEKLHARIDCDEIRNIEARLVLGELTYTLDDAVDFIHARLDRLDELLSDYHYVNAKAAQLGLVDQDDS